MRKICFIIGLLLLHIKVFANPKSDYTLTLAINLTDCLNCSKTMYDLQFFKDKYNIRIVFQSEYQSDSLEIFNNYNFKEIADEIIWSDSEYAAYTPNDGTFVSIESKYKVQKFTLRIHDIEAKKFLPFLSNQNLLVDTLFKAYPKLAKGVNEIKFGNEYLGFNVAYNNTIQVYDYISQQHKYKIEIKEAILRKSFLFNADGLPAKEYDAQYKAMKTAGVPNLYVVGDYFFAGDTLYHTLNNRYFRYSKQIDKGVQKIDTSLEHNIALLSYVNGSLINLTKCNIICKIGADDYIMSDNLHYSNGKIIERIDGPVKKDRFYLANLLINKKQEIYAEPKLNFRIPKIFDKTDVFTYLKYYKNTYAFIALGKVFSLDDGSEIENVPFFPNPEELSDYSKLKACLMKYVINDDYFWFNVQFNTTNDKLSKFYKLNRKTKVVETSELSFPIERTPILSFDPLNPDYLIYKNSEGYLIREKIFK